MSRAPKWLLWAAVAVICGLAIGHDFRRQPAVGDQASHLLQAVSLAYDFDLKYEPGDIARWGRIGWDPTPVGLMYQTYSGGAAFAKPYLYSAALAPFIRLAGVRFGVSLTNCAIFILLILLSLKTARLYFNETLAPLVVAAFFLASNAYFYVFVIQPDLFHALLTASFCYAALRYFRSGNNRFVYLMAVLLGVSVSEKVSMLFLLSPIFLYALTKAGSWRVRLLAITITIAGFGFSLLPYLHYSDYKSWNAYGGARFVNREGLPELDPQKLVEQSGGTAGNAKFPGLRLPTTELLRSAWYYIFGAYTGVFIFTPAILFFGIASLLSRSRRKQILPWALGIGLMVLSYLSFDPINYFGGGQSIGNRWFVKAIPVALALAVEARLSFARSKKLSIAALVVSAVLIYPSHLDPVHAFQECTRSGRLQRWFPLEVNQISVPHYVGGRDNPVNISWYPRPPHWHVSLEGEPQVWLWKNGALVLPECRVLYQQEYFRLDGKSFFALLEETDAGVVYATYHFARVGQFRSTSKHASLLVRCVTGRLPIKVMPLGHATQITALSGGSAKQFILPTTLALQPEQSLPDHFYQIDFSGDDNFWFFPGDASDSASAQTLPMR